MCAALPSRCDSLVLFIFMLLFVLLPDRWAPLFNPKSAAVLWQTTVKAITAKPAPGGVRRVVSPAAAGDPDTQAGVDCSADPAVGNNPHFCHGWLKQLKAYALQLDCTSILSVARSQHVTSILTSCVQWANPSAEWLILTFALWWPGTDFEGKQTNCWDVMDVIQVCVHLLCGLFTNIMLFRGGGGGALVLFTPP